MRSAARARIPLRLTAGGCGHRFNNLDRAQRLPPTLAPSQAPSFYLHLNRLKTFLHHPSFELQLRLGPGYLIAIDNWRVMHGRTSFDETSGRALAGCYLSEEEVRVRREHLRTVFA